MKLERTDIHGCHVIHLDRHVDERGFVEETYNDSRYASVSCGLELHSARRAWVQTSVTRSKRHVLRGIHVAPFSRLVTCLSGKVYDVVVDLREGPTFGTWLAKSLSGDKPEQLLIPAGCGHAFLAYEDSMLLCQQDEVYSSGLERTVRWDDPQLGIHWPVISGDFILSKRDETASFLEGL